MLSGGAAFSLGQCRSAVRAYKALVLDWLGEVCVVEFDCCFLDRLQEMSE